MKFRGFTFTKKRILWTVVTSGCILIGFLLLGVYSHLSGALEDQNMAKRWSQENDVAQISCFFPYDTQITPDKIYMFQSGLDRAMIEASIQSKSPNANARLWASAYSAMGKLTVYNDRTSVSLEAMGVGEDFFLFHPVKLLDGNYFSGQDVMDDYCIVDEEAAWKLFGSNDIVGQYVMISGVPHKITGVYERETGHIYEKAGLNEGLIYVSYDTLAKYGGATEIQCYEIVMPNPVRNYALNYVTEQLGDQDGKIEILENTSRFSKSKIFKLLAEYGTRSMKTKAIAYPYWENVARGYEDYLTTILPFICLFFFFPFTVILICVIMAWRKKTWTSKTVFQYIKIKSEGISEWYRNTRELRKKERSEEDEF